MIKTKAWLLLVMGVVCLTLGTGQTWADVDTRIVNTYKLTFSPVDIEVSLSGQRIFVLDDQGDVLVYDMTGGLTETIPVGGHVDQIKVSPRDDVLFLGSRKDKSVQVMTLTFTQEINVSGSPFQGPADAPVSIVVFSDFQCPYCARIPAIIDQVRKEYPKNTRTVFKHFPLSSHKFAQLASQASIAADAQGKFWEFHDLLFQNYSQLNEEKIDEIRATLNLKKAPFEKVMHAPQTIEKVNRDKQEGEQAGVRGTPTVFVNGRMVRPANLEGIKQAVEDALKALQKK